MLEVGGSKYSGIISRCHPEELLNAFGGQEQLLSVANPRRSPRAQCVVHMLAGGGIDAHSMGSRAERERESFFLKIHKKCFLVGSVSHWEG